MLIELKNVEVRHVVPVITGRSSCRRVIIFFDPKDSKTYVWKTSSFSGFRFAEGEICSITAQSEKPYELKKVKLIESEQDIQPDKSDLIDAYDVLFGCKDYQEKGGE